ncbi:MAG: hypothetical protein EB086_14820, partial [Rhodobacteraceae bacterium]|nr:hypothetical protein [Paracoccaceae bacterium]
MAFCHPFLFRLFGHFRSGKRPCPTRSLWLIEALIHNKTRVKWPDIPNGQIFSIEKGAKTRRV